MCVRACVWLAVLKSTSEHTYAKQIQHSLCMHRLGIFLGRARKHSSYPLESILPL